MTASEAASLVEKIPDNPGQAALMGLAVIGGGALGALVSGLLVQGGTKLGTGQTIPRWALNAARALGGLTTALVLFVLLFTEPGGRGPGPGGPGSGSGEGVSLFPSQSRDEPQKTTDKPPETPKEAKPLRVVVTQAQESGKWYQVEGDNKRHSLKEITDLIRDKKQAQPPIASVVVVLTHPDSPGKRTGPVEDLTNWIDEAKLKVSYELPRESDPR